MNLLAEIHGYPPYHNSGAEWMAHHIFRYLVDIGHDVTILLNFNSYLGKIKEPYTFDGVSVVSDKDYDHYYRWADVVFTHLDKTGKAYNRCKLYNRPLINIVHNDYNNNVMSNLNGIEQYAIYNTYWVQDKVSKINKMVKKSIVIHPPIWAKDYEVEKRNDYITLINLNNNKGGDFFIKLAKRLPDKKFMGVMGSYGDQKIDWKQKNIHYVKNRGDIKYVYKRTRILLMPSIYESYGRTAIEAASSGIPIICTPTPGLQEALAGTGIYMERDVERWALKILQLDDERKYQIASKAVRKRAEEVNPEKELNKLVKFLENV